jgi:hypothetical protein
VTNLVTELLAGRSLWFGLDYKPATYLPVDGHLTVAYVGKLDDDARTDYYATSLAMKALDALPEIARHADLLKATVDGWARLSAPDKGGALVVLVKFHTNAAFEMRNVARNLRPYSIPLHWTPHITSEYFKTETPTLVSGSAPEPIVFTHATLNCGDFVQRKELHHE